MSAIPKRPKFFTAFCNSVGAAYERKGIKSVVPWWLIVGVGVGGAAAWHMPATYWSDQKWDVATTVYTGFLAFDGLLLALGWGAFSKIYEILSQNWFAAFLRRNDLLNDHLFFIDAVHGMLVLSAVISGVALVTGLLPLPIWTDQVVLACVIASSFWSLTKALSTMKVMNDLVWELAHTEPDEKGHLRPVETSGAQR